MRKVKAPVLSYDEFYSRQLVMKELGRRGQKKLVDSRVAVVGLGGLGTISSLYLALAGIGYLRLIDQDTIEANNLHRQVLYNSSDLHYPKAEVSAKRLRKANPMIKIDAIPENLNLDNVDKLLSDVDCVVDGLDNMKTRYMINRTCVNLRIPYIFGAAIGIEGNLSVFASPETPCLECVFPNVEDESLMSCDTRGVLSATPGIIGSMQAIETIKTLTDIGSPLKGKLLICDFSDMYFATVDVSKNKRCPACQKGARLQPKQEKLVWLCGRNTVNVNPEHYLQLNMSQTYKSIKRQFKVRVKSRLAVIFDYKGFEITLFSGGRMLIKNVDNEESALRLYRDVMGKLGLGK